jgi:hypothetical protein
MENQFQKHRDGLALKLPYQFLLFVTFAKSQFHSTFNKAYTIRACEPQRVCFLERLDPLDVILHLLLNFGGAVCAISSRTAQAAHENAQRHRQLS